MALDPAASNHNFAFAANLFDGLARSGVRHVVVSPGSRSAPLAAAAARHPALRCWSQIDERAGAFFALGMAKAERAPVAAVCTSGTAAVNFHPAVVEAHHARVPLLLLTADRPPELRDWGAGQTIDQVNLYGRAVRWFAEAPVPESGACGLEATAQALAYRAVATASGRPAGPVHLNLPFREPLAPTPVPGALVSHGRAPIHARVAEAASRPSPDLVASLLDSLREEERGVVICGPLEADPDTTDAIAGLAAALGWPLLADPASQLRCGEHTAATPVITGYDHFLSDRSTAQRLAPRRVLRFGDSPTSKSLRLWLERVPPEALILIDADAAWHDPSHIASQVVPVAPGPLADALLRRLAGSVAAASSWLQAFRAADDCVHQVVEREVSRETALLEPRVVHELKATLPAAAILYVSNSMPIRDVDRFLSARSALLRILCNRGANGIDGMVSSALGASAACDAPLVLLTGDLAFVYDAGGLAAAARHDLRATFVVIDNGGGGIFSFLPIAEHGEAVGFEEHFRTPHGLDLVAVARAYGAHAERVDSVAAFRSALEKSLVAEGVSVLVIPVDPDHSVSRRRALERSVAAELERLA